jgi:hypothetical protein
MNNIKDITIIPAKFIEFENDKTCIIKCLIGHDKNDNPIIQNRKFENEMIELINNPNYLFIGLMQGKGFTQIIFTDAKEYEDMFEEKWGILTI